MMRRYIAMAAVLAMPTMAVEAGEITWSVANGFQQFKNDSDFQKIKNVWKPDMTAEGFLTTQNGASLRALLPIRQTWWDEATGLYDNSGLFNPSHDLMLLYQGASPAQSCQWSLNGSTVAPASPCNVPAIAKAVTEGEEFVITVSVDGAPAQDLRGQQIRATLILAVGDSFASGEGNPDHAAVTATVPSAGSGLENKTSVKSIDWLYMGNNANGRFVESADWWDTACHRSLLSWQSMYALKKAIADPHLVVRFASFSCSGAEAYDGFFRAQINPPVDTGTPRSLKINGRDGGNVMKLVAVKEEHKAESKELQENTAKKLVLNKSQLNAAIALLCKGKTSPGLSKSYRAQIDGLRKSPYYGAFKYDSCEGGMRAPDLLLTSFGGNDFGFSGVVMWGLAPETPIQRDGLAGATKTAFNGFLLAQMRSIIGVQDPVHAGRVATKQTVAIYSDLQAAFHDILKTDPERVYALIYPNPLPSSVSEECSGRMGQGNVALREFTKDKGAKSILSNAYDNFIFRIENKSAKIIVSEFINPLQVAQRGAIKAVKWAPIESQRGFESPSGDRTMCGVAKGCSSVTGHCDVADLAGWRDPRKGGDQYPSWFPIANISQWEPYSPTRVRGLRMGNDAAMTQARFVDKKFRRTGKTDQFIP